MKELSKREIGKIFKKEDYTEIINCLNKSEISKLQRAYSDLDFYKSLNNVQVVESIQSIINKIESKAVSIWCSKNMEVK